MSPGKLATQAGHAYLGAFLAAQAQARPETSAYATLSPGTKVCLQGKLTQLIRVLKELAQLELPHFVVVDSGCADFFAAQPVTTAVGFGPATRSQIQHITRRFQLL